MVALTDWSCDFVCRWYFTALFQANDRSQWSTNCPQNNFPSTVELLRKGLAELEWATIQKCGDSSKSGFPIEDIWQTAFYAAIGGFIPSSFSFCKEKVTSNDKRIDFVLRNGSKWGIEFLIKSSKVEEHHSRFECGGSYSTLNLDAYLVVDILPWGKEPDLFCVSTTAQLQRARECFEKLTGARRNAHAVFLIGNDLQKGILYLYNDEQRVYEALRSPQAA